MLPPQLQQGVRPRSLSMPAATTIATSASSLLRASATIAQSRGFWGWRRQADYASHIDPQFQRFCRYRTLKTRAKLLDKLRRRGRWDWDADQRPFFNPRHVRLASHIGRPRWTNNEDGNEKKDTKEPAAEDDAFELSQREKEWKEQMEAMRRRVEQDPYEAVFGKRSEPFWSPLVPTWMREEMGLSRFPKSKEATKPYKPIQSEPNASEASNKQSKRDTDAVHPNGQLTEYAYPENKNPVSKSIDPDSPNGQLTSYSYSRRKPASSSENPESPNGQLTSYSYTSSTSWDSWTKKARKDEWDSISGQRRRFEYDPISNRMVQIQTPKLNAATEDPVLAETQTKKPVELPTKSSKNTAVDVPVKTAVEPRQAIPVPTHTTSTSVNEQPRYSPSVVNSSASNKYSSSVNLLKTPEKALDSLTADDIRASMRKVKQDRAATEPELPNQALTKHDDKSAPDEWQYRLREAKEKNAWIAAQLEKFEKLDTNEPARASKPSQGRSIVEGLKTVLFQANNRGPGSSLQTSVDRMQSKEIPAAVEPDDSAAHESTGEAVDYSSANLPKDWEKQADLLQADRVKRTRGSSEASSAKAASSKSDRWIDIMNAKKAKYEAKVIAERAATEARDAEKNAKLATTDSMLEAEVRDQKLRLMAYENRYAHGALADAQHKLQQEAVKNPEDKQALQSERERYQQKIRDLRKELDTSFKQSSVSADMHLDRIRDLEKELALTRNFGHDTLQVERDRYMHKTKDLKEELNRTFKQSSVNAEMQVERIRDLERELEEARAPKASTKSVEATRAEGDFCANVTKYAKDSNKWYKKPCYIPEATSKPTRAEMEEAERRSKDEALTSEIKDIYEAEYGPIDTMKSEKTQVVEVETDVDLGKALADYEKEQEYEFRKPRQTLEQEVAAEEKAAHEAQALLDPYPQYSSDATQANGDSFGMRVTDDKAPQVLSSEASANSVEKDASKWGIQWEEPPVYKVLAYDSGNDLLTTAVTSSNVTGIETSISIPEALSQLYQPARFVPHFAELQREGFQVIYATKDLLIFKKVKATSNETSTTLQDHGLIKDKSPEAKSYPAGVNPIDGMSYSVEPNTGSFASPTGFVGDRWDTISGSEGKAQSPSTVSKSTIPQHESFNEPNEDVDIKHYPRVKREEHVFSGSRLQSRRRPTKREVKETKRKWRGWRSRIQWALGVGLGASVVAYGVGAVAERKERRDKERWQQILEGKKGRWE